MIDLETAKRNAEDILRRAGVRFSHLKVTYMVKVSDKVRINVSYWDMDSQFDTSALMELDGIKGDVTMYRVGYIWK